LPLISRSQRDAQLIPDDLVTASVTPFDSPGWFNTALAVTTAASATLMAHGLRALDLSLAENFMAILLLMVGVNTLQRC
jgi:hypothetical protein